MKEAVYHFILSFQQNNSNNNNNYNTVTTVLIRSTAHALIQGRGQGRGQIRWADPLEANVCLCPFFAKTYALQY